MSASKIALSGFNNISKSIIASFYHIAYTPRPSRQQDFLKLCNHHYSDTRIEKLLQKISQQIGATVLFSSRNAYAPLGASATVLIAEGNVSPPEQSESQSEPESESESQELSTKKTSPPSPQQESQVIHLDKSHIALHTYPEAHEELNIATFRIDLDLSTCGEVNPLTALPTLFRSLTPDVFSIDVRLRGFTRDALGDPCFDDGVLYSASPPINPIQTQIETTYPNTYLITETLLQKHRTLMAKGILKNFDENFSAHGLSSESQEILTAKFEPQEKTDAELRIKTEATKIFSNLEDTQT